MRFVLFFLLASCASPSPTYERGTFVRPPPAPHRPGVGAPLVGQPGTGQEQYPRSPGTRVLPPSKEKGLWAPRAGDGRTTQNGPIVFGVRMPTPEGELVKAKPWEAKCAAVIDAASRDLEIKRRILLLPEAETRCLAYAAYSQCLDRLAELARTRRAVEQYERTETKHLLDMQGLLVLMVQVFCKETTGPEIQGLRMRVGSEARKILKEPGDE